MNKKYKDNEMYYIDYYEHFVTDRSITLYWDKPDRAPRNIVYKVLLDGKLKRNK